MADLKITDDTNLDKAKDWADGVENPLEKVSASDLVRELVSRCPLLALVAIAVNAEGKPEGHRYLHGDPVDLYGHVGTLFDEIKENLAIGRAINRQKNGPKIAVPRGTIN